MTSAGALRFGADYSETIELTDGTRVRLRMGRPEDAPLLLEGFAQLSPDSRYSRFLAARESLTPAEVEYLTRPDGWDHVAIGALVDGPDGREHGIGVARFVRFADAPDAADVAVTVIDAYQRRGLGTALLRRLFEAARERGIRRLRFEVLADNRRMLALLHGLSPRVVEHVEGGVATGEVVLDDAAAAAPGAVAGGGGPGDGAATPAGGG
ncbi:MAG: GNAT family N-acetyltransferase [Deltaproteobacteria bacterium]|nr:MAG: GNAT family N-acetyltransferase [Deltaproteobacteria bacterium]